MNRLMQKQKRCGFSLIEVLLAAFFLSMVLIGILWMNSFSGKSSLDAYYEFLALQLAMEPIEVFRAFGYEWLKNYADHPLPDYPVGWADISQNSTQKKVKHPLECRYFQREITLTPVTKGNQKAVRITVRVAPKAQTRVKTWLSKDVVSFSSLVVEGFK